MRLLTSEGNQASEASSFAAWLSAIAQSSDAALGAALAVHALGAGEALFHAADEEGLWGPGREVVEAVARPRIVTDMTQLRAYCMEMRGLYRWALLLPRAHSLIDIVVWESGNEGPLAVVPMVHRNERLAQVGWLANATRASVPEARDALARWVMAAPAEAEARAVLKPYAWLLDVEPEPVDSLTSEAWVPP